ncbi:unnamed protein product [Pleuronectes platessa]|uniref:Uncharacterized protein n=1 Tax=Pleuronectes platessa TaxID=8262 RepID=A0A9N7W1C3_PLEPL|nr:unnamed protein product [Pleuronectes platessa]
MGWGEMERWGEESQGPSYSSRPLQKWGATEPQPTAHGHGGPEERGGVQNGGEGRLFKKRKNNQGLYGPADIPNRMHYQIQPAGDAFLLDARRATLADTERSSSHKAAERGTGSPVLHSHT